MATATLVTVFNTTDGPLFVDRAGHIVGAHEWRTGVDVTVTPAKTYVADGRLVVTPSAPAEPTP